MGSTAVMNVMMSWLKGLASWVLDLFNLAGSSGFSPLGWLADNWVKLLVFFMIAGVFMDVLIWLMRWRPYWVWFRKRRIVINDDNFFAGEELVDSGLYDPSLFYDPEVERRQKAPSTIVKPERKRPALIERVEDDELTPKRPARASMRRPSGARVAPAKRPVRARKSDVDPLFRVDPAREIDPVSGEDAVFNVSDLPVSRDELALRKKRRRR
jgi:hypothetical protein